MSNYKDGPCASCGRPRTKRVTGSGWVCLPCERAKAKAWRGANRQLSRDIVRNAQLKRRYGITLEQKAAMVAARDGKCDICGKQPNPEWKRAEDRVLHVDHDHTTGRVRGLLCGPCNKALAWFESFEPKAKEYLNS